MQYCEECRRYPAGDPCATEGAKYVISISFLYGGYIYKFNVDLYHVLKIACLCKN
jgi:hypothetical protein